MERKTIYHKSGRHACGFRIHDKGEHILMLPSRVRSDVPSTDYQYRDYTMATVRGRIVKVEAKPSTFYGSIAISASQHDRVCVCFINSSPTFTSQPQPLDLQMYDKILK